MNIITGDIKDRLELSDELRKAYSLPLSENEAMALLALPPERRLAAVKQYRNIDESGRAPSAMPTRFKTRQRVSR